MTITTAIEQRPADPRRLDRAFLACQLLATRGSMTSTGLDRELNSRAANAWTEDSQIMVMAKRGIVQIAELGFSTSAHWILLPQGWRQLLAEPALVEEGWQWLEQSSTLDVNEIRLVALITALAPVGVERLADEMEMMPGAVRRLLRQLDGRGLVIQRSDCWLLNPIIEEHVLETDRERRTCANPKTLLDALDVAIHEGRAAGLDEVSAIVEAAHRERRDQQPGMQRLMRRCFRLWQVTLPGYLSPDTVEQLRLKALVLTSTAAVTKPSLPVWSSIIPFSCPASERHTRTIPRRVCETLRTGLVRYRLNLGQRMSAQWQNARFAAGVAYAVDENIRIADDAADHLILDEKRRSLSKAIVKAMPRLLTSWNITPEQLAAMLAMTPERLSAVRSDHKILLTPVEIERGEHLLALYDMAKTLYGKGLSQCWVHLMSMAKGYNLGPAIDLMMGTMEELVFVRRGAEAELQNCRHWRQKLGKQKILDS